MKRKIKVYKTTRTVELPALLNYLRNQSHFMLLNNSFLPGSDVRIEKSFEFMVGIAGLNNKNADQLENIDDLLATAKSEKQFVFGHIGYGLKDKIENLNSQHKDSFNWPLIHFFIPEKVIRVSAGAISIEADNEIECDEIYEKLVVASALTNTVEEHGNSIEVLPAPAKENYLEKVHTIKKHIHRGDIYEMNYCMEMKAKNITIDPYWSYWLISEKSPAPFSCFYRDEDNYLLCSSPERFIKRTGDKIISQPIKGTSRRSTNAKEDDALKEHLRNSEKEHAENVMIVDLVRNDLSRIAKRSSVKVEELFGIYSFPTVHQMISTISADIRADVTFSEVIRALFPMGSMTGAPKIRAMQLIDEYEDFNRGLYSGSVGCIAPDGGFDFNVVIRSVLYNQVKKIFSIPVGSAITAASVATDEYDECLLKAHGLLKSLGVLPLTSQAL